MNQSPFKTKKFKKLFDKWNKKLVESGHDEIEDFSLPEPPLKSWDNFKFKKPSPEQFDAKQSYFQSARTLLEIYEFESEIHRKIWELHSEGFSIRQIVTKINKKKFKRDSIHNIILHIKKELN
jgi:hypothetical protein